MTKQVARLSDVARSAGVSVATVSRYLKNSLRLSEDGGRAHPRGHRRTGLPAESARAQPQPRSPRHDRSRYGRRAAAVEREGARRGYRLTLCESLDTPEREREYLAKLSRMAVNGINFVTNHPAEGALKQPLPNRLSVIGFDDIAPFVLFDPPPTSIRQPVEAMGRRAVDLLVRGLGGEDVDDVVERLPVELVLRESVSRPPPSEETREAIRAIPHKETAP